MDLRTAFIFLAPALLVMVLGWLYLRRKFGQDIPTAYGIGLALLSFAVGFGVVWIVNN